MNETEEEMSKKELISRMIAFILFGLILPFSFIAWRYSIFEVNKISLSGWGIIAILIVVIFCVYTMRMLKKIMANQKKYSLTIQIINGFLSVLLPMITVLLLVRSIKNNIDFFEQALIVCICCEAVAIIVNPLPKIEFESGVNNTNSTIQNLVNYAKMTKGGKK